MWDIEFILRSMDGVEQGKISKQWSGLVKEYFTNADNFGINCKSFGIPSKLH